MGAHRALRRARHLPAGRRLVASVVSLPLAASTLGLVLLGATTASATATVTDPVTVTAFNWYWNKTAELPALPVPLPVAPPPLPATDIPIPDGILVPAGDLAVSFRGEPSGQPDRETYLSFSLGGATPGVKVTSFTFTLTIDQGNITNAKTATVPLIACFPSRSWDKGKGGALWSDKPQDDCDNAPAGTYDAAKQTYTFQVASFAQDWANGTNIGVAIRHAKSQITPFILAFKGASMVTGAISYLPALPAVPSVPITPVAPQHPSVVGTAPDLGTACCASSTVQPPAVPTAPMPGVTVAPNTLTPAGGTHAIGVTSFDRRFWLSTLVGVLGVMLLALFVARRPVPAMATAAPVSRLSQVLNARGSLAASHLHRP